MGDATVKPSDGDDLVLQNNHAGAKIEINENDTISITPSIQSDNINIDANTIKSTSGGLTVQAYTAMLLRVNDGDNNVQLYADGSVEFYGDVDINGGTLAGFTIDGSWTAASQTCADLGTVTTVDINGGTIDGCTITGNISGNAGGTATTVTGATQSAITTATNLVTVGALDTGSITSGFTSIDVGAGAIATTGALTGGTATVTGLITANGGIETDTNSKVIQKGAFMQSSTHQALTLGA